MNMQTLDNCILVAVGGAIGSICRYLMGLIPLKNSYNFPTNTLLINLIGTFCIGIIFGYLQRHGELDSRWILLLQVGFCGGFTTLSSVTLDIVRMQTAGQLAVASIYYGATIVLCLLSTWLGVWAVTHS